MSDPLLRPQDLAMWNAARPFLDVRNNDTHTLVAYGLAKSLLGLMPDGDPDVVLPAILLHDVGWKKIDPDLLLLAIGKNPTRKDLVRDHEVFGVKIARDILGTYGRKDVDADAVLAIIDGHDTVKEGRSLNDAIVKDADKGWRTTMHGMRTIRGWYDWTMLEYVEALEKVSLPYMLTDAGRAISSGFLTTLRAEMDLESYMEGAPLAKV
jgi:hypothetical protein